MNGVPKTTYEKANAFFGHNNDEEKSNTQSKVRDMYGMENDKINPFLDKQGKVFNKYTDYQKILDNPNTNRVTKLFIQQATGLAPSETQKTETYSQIPGAKSSITKVDGKTETGYQRSSNGALNPFEFNSNADENNLAKLDVVTELPKLSQEQISKIISQHFGKSTVISPSDAKGIYDAQQKSGMSALAILGIGALESGYGTSNIAKKKNNLWGWNATNTNPGENATAFSPVAQGAMEFADKYMATYYNKYGAKSIYSAGTGDNPAGKGYAYYDNGVINLRWSASINSIMRNFYNTAKTVEQPAGKSDMVNVAKKYIGTPYVWGGESMSEGGMDCSGFVYNVLKDSGFKYGRTTAQGYRAYGTAVNKKDMQPGDLIFFGKNKATHIGIYIGNGQMIHSSGDSSNTASNPGKGVSIANVNYRSDFLEARRY